MRHDQPDPADDAADRNGGGRYQRSAKNNNQPQPPGVNAQSPGFFVPQRQHIDFPAQQKQRYQSGRHDQSGKSRVTCPEPARLPISQYVMAGSWSVGSATNLTSDVAAVNKEPTTIPDKISASICLPWVLRLISQAAPVHSRLKKTRRQRQRNRRRRTTAPKPPRTPRRKTPPKCPATPSGSGTRPDKPPRQRTKNTRPDTPSEHAARGR